MHNVDLMPPQSTVSFMESISEFQGPSVGSVKTSPRRYLTLSSGGVLREDQNGRLKNTSMETINADPCDVHSNPTAMSIYWGLSRPAEEEAEPVKLLSKSTNIAYKKSKYRCGYVW